MGVGAVGGVATITRTRLSWENSVVDALIHPAERSTFLMSKITGEVALNRTNTGADQPKS